MKVLGTAAVTALLVTVIVSGCGGSSSGKVSLLSECGSSAGKAVLPLECDFSTGVCTPLQAFEDEFGQGKCAAAGYEIVVKKPLLQVGLLNLQHRERTLRVATSAIQRAGPGRQELHGVFCRASDTVSYLLGVGSDGSFAIFKVNSREGRRTVLKEGSRARGRSATGRRKSHIQGMCLAGGREPTTLVLYSDGSLLTATSDPEGPAGFLAVGMFAASARGGAKIRFDAFSARKLTATEAGSPTRLVVDDDFSYPESGWPNSGKGSFATEYAEGGYRIRANGDGESVFFFKGSARALSIEADVTERSGRRTDESHGVVCGVARGFSGYAFAISPAAGSYEIARQGEVYVPLATGNVRSGLHGVGETNHIRAVCILGGSKRPNSLILWVNGKKVGQAVDRAGGDELIGIDLSVTTAGGSTDVLFDDVVAARLTERQAAAQAMHSPPPPPRRPGVLLQDDFDRSTALWPQSSDDGSQTAHQEGGYRILVKRPYSGLDITSRTRVPPVVVEPPVTGLRIKVVARERPGHEGGSFGVICLSEPSDQDFRQYEFLINPTSGGYKIQRLDEPGPARLLADGTASAVVQGGSRKVIEADCVGKPSGATILILRVNGTQLGKARDPNGIPRFDGFALTVVSGQNGEDVLFDDLVVRKR